MPNLERRRLAASFTKVSSDSEKKKRKEKSIKIQNKKGGERRREGHERGGEGRGTTEWV